MTDKRRCIKCEVLKEEKNFTKVYARFCDPCYMGMRNSTEVRRFEDIFLSAAQEIFCLRYSTGTSHLAVTVPNDEEGKKKLFKEGKQRVEINIKRENKWNYQANIQQLQVYETWVASLESKYK